ncbi:dynein heavy chain 10, axonemal-like [Pecten maximus]|uniref:dynein heavy chain 10, axonemal-like n=1 Tax=Pecten maximus TaxID=6579 RepID=UPI001458B391|nr:dynein heavy chain 10, axonemal-like [Pecten maximus]
MAKAKTLKQKVEAMRNPSLYMMNIKKGLEKLFEWQSAAAQLKPYLPQGDQVLGAWFQSMSEFKKNLPALHKLANEALKERHWKAIFVGMNETYDGMKQYTVADLLAYDLEEHAQLIHNIYLGAIEEFDLEVKITQISKMWEEREFKLAKHIPDSVTQRKRKKYTGWGKKKGKKILPEGEKG